MLICGFHASVGHHFEIFNNVANSILKTFGQEVDNLIKGLAASSSDMNIHYIFARPLGTIYFKL
jgi:hypothetical protein